MSILLNRNTRVLVQGITGKIGQAQTKWMLAYGTNIVAGVTPGRGGAAIEGVPVFDSVADAVKATGAEASVFFVPARSVKDTVFETLEAGIKLVVVVTEHVPVHDTMEMRGEAKKIGATLLGPTTPGILTVGEAKMGIIPGNLFPKVGGRAGVISRSGTLAYEVGGILAKAGTAPSSSIRHSPTPAAASPSRIGSMAPSVADGQVWSRTTAPSPCASTPRRTPSVTNALEWPGSQSSTATCQPTWR